MLKHVTGNLIDLAKAGCFQYIIHGCNCMQIMGNGIAKEIKSRYPQAYSADLETVKGDKGKLGDYSFAFSNEGFWIINAYTQYDIAKKKGDDVFDYEAFEIVLNKLAYEIGDCRIGMPYIGMGLAGGDSSRIMKMIEKFAERCYENGGEVTLVKFG